MLRLRVLVTVPYSDPPACRSDTCHGRPFSSMVFGFFSFGGLSLAMIFVFARVFFAFPFGNSLPFSLGSFRKKKKRKEKREENSCLWVLSLFLFLLVTATSSIALCVQCSYPCSTALCMRKIASLLKFTRAIHMLDLVKLTKSLLVIVVECANV
jgi:hypothetical protein